MMSTRKCSECLYGDQCPAHLTCRHFTPLDDPFGNDDVVEEYIEDERREYAEAFFSYWFDFENRP